MDNKELAILIRAWRNRLSREVDLLGDLLPDDFPREIERVYVGATTLGGMIETERDDPTKWKDHPGEYTALLGLYELVNELTQAADSLVGNDQA